MSVNEREANRLVDGTLGTQGTGGTGPWTGDELFKPWINRLSASAWVELIIVDAANAVMAKPPQSRTAVSQCGTAPPRCLIAVGFAIRRELYDPIDVKDVRTLINKKGLVVANYTLYLRRRFPAPMTIVPIDVLDKLTTRMSVLAVNVAVSPSRLPLLLEELTNRRETMPARMWL